METLKRRLETIKDDIEETLDYLKNEAQAIVRGVQCPWHNIDGNNCKFMDPHMNCHNIADRPTHGDAWCMKRVRMAQYILDLIKGFKDELC